MYGYEDLSLTDMPGEHWKPIDGFEDLYEISSMGRVKSLRREVSSQSRNMRLQTERILRQRAVKVKNKKVGDFLYTMIVHLSQDGKKYHFSVGRLVYHTFIAPIDLGSRAVLISYRDGDGRNLYVENLYASNLSELKLRSFRNGRALSHLNVLSKPVSQFLPDGRLVAQYPSYYAAAKATGYHASSIASVASGGYYLYKGFSWQQGKSKRLKSSTLPSKGPATDINYKLLEKLGMKKVPERYSALFDLSQKSRPGELWKDIPGYEGLYKLSNHGRVKALKMVTSGKQQKWHPERVMNLSIIIHERKDGSVRLDMPYVTLCKNQRKRKVVIARLIFHLFVQPFDTGKSTLRVYVKDGNPLNIHYRNLELRDAVWSINKATKKGRQG